MMADRFRERLAVLDREALLSYAAELSVVLRHTADVLLATHSPLPSWARDEVMLSADLLPLVFATLRLKDGAAASVCQAWKAAWEVTNDSRRGLRPLALPQPDFELKLVDDDGGDCRIDAVELPDGNLLVRTERRRRRTATRILDPAMKTIRIVKNLEIDRDIIANDLGLFAGCIGTDGFTGYAGLRRYDLDTFTMTHEYNSGLDEHGEHHYYELGYLTFAPDSVIFAVATFFDGYSQEVVCFDARTLEVRHRFGHAVSVENGGDGLPCGMAASDNELFVLIDETHANVSAIKVFSLAGSLLRSLSLGRCFNPCELYHFDGRLYLRDYDRIEVDDFDYIHKTRIMVLSVEGERLQVWRPPRRRNVDEILGIHGRKLLIRTSDNVRVHAQGNARIEALQGI